jgi:hypothetical protein
LYYTISQFFVNDIPLVPTLQSVTDAGNTTTNYIVLQTTSAFYNYESHLYGNQLGTYNSDSGYAVVMSADGLISFTNGFSGGAGWIDFRDVTSSGVYFNLPDKPAATYIIATTADIPSLTGFVPYTGATGNVDLGSNNLTAQNVSAQSMTLHGTDIESLMIAYAVALG